MKVRACPACGRTKPLSAFPNWKYGPGGRRNQCRKCHTAANEKYRKKNLARVRANERARRARNPELHRQQAREYRKRHPEKIRVANANYRATHSLERAAHHAVETALRKGWMKKPPACERCKKTAPVSGHHADYTKPLEVEWLCSSCHKLEHA